MAAQLSLALSLRDEATFDNFLVRPDSVRAQAVQVLQGKLYPGQHLVYLWGAPQAGVSHLLQAACHYYLEQQRGAQYLPLQDMIGFEAESLLVGLEQLPLVCLEDIDRIQGNPQWEKAIFTLYNSIRDRGGLMLVAADRSPRELQLGLADLKSRWSSGLTYHFNPYNDEEKLAILRFRASRLGLELGEDVALFILTRGSRNMDQLMTYLKQLDAESLRARRRITIPFVKETFHW
ncbi:MAG: DnaA regulatory inactivator Hda [Porticoccaceae bacterium]|nr:DnaA regulatory inactivator Hda [Porticoccaceae bacterium]